MSISLATVPTADIESFTLNHPLDARRKAAKNFAAAVRQHGCVGVTGHGLSQEKLDKAFTWMRKFFALTREQKLMAPHPPGAMPPRGYSEPGREQASKLLETETEDEAEKKALSALKDWKETYDVGSELNEESNNVWLPDDILPGFRTAMVDLWETLNNISSNILEALMLGIDLDETEQESVRELHQKGFENQMRLAHYLPVTPEMLRDLEVTRLAAHRDFSSFTLLAQESRAGLEFQNRDTGEFMPAPPRDSTIYLNIADMFDRLSNGYYPSSLHRVAVPTEGSKDSGEGLQTVPSRLSIPFFVVPNTHARIAPLASRIAVDGKARYETLSLLEYVQKMFAAAHSGS